MASHTRDLPEAPQRLRSGMPRSSASDKDLAFYVCNVLILAAVGFDGFGNQIGGLVLPLNLSTYLVIAVLLFLMPLNRVFVPRCLVYLYALTILLTFVLNYRTASYESLKGEIGLLIYSLALFNYVYLFRDRISAMVKVYYMAAFAASLFIWVQVSVFIGSGKLIMLQALFPGAPEYNIGERIFGLFPRAPGIASEPAHMATLLLPAAYIALLSFRNRIHGGSKMAALTVLTAVLMTFSLSAYAGLLLIVLFMMLSEVRRPILKGFVVLIVLLPLGYATVADVGVVNSRIRGLLLPLQTADHEWTTNDLTTFALLSNWFVATSSLKDSAYLGTGMKTHQASYDKYLHSYFPEESVLMELNKADAASLYIRVISEFGLPGIALFGLFIVKYRVRQEGRHYHVNTAAFFYLVLYSIRTAAYLDTLFWFFAALYYVTRRYPANGDHAGVRTQTLRTSAVRCLPPGDEAGKPLPGGLPANP